MALPYSRTQLIQRIRKHCNDGFINDSYSVSDNEITLYINDAIGFGLVGEVFAGAKVTGTMEIPEGYLVTYLLPAITQDPVSGNWTSSLPQPPMSMPLGYSITRVYFAQNSYGQSYDFWPIKNKRRSYRIYMQRPLGGQYWVENTTIWLSTSDGGSLMNQPLYVQMPSARAADPDAPLNLPDDAISAVFDMVVKRILQRGQIPRDIIADDLPAGNNNVKTQR